MAAQTLNCPNCGAAASTEATRCSHCNSRLATIACPSCFGMMFVGAKFCSHCGAKADRKEVAEDKPHPCPRCKSDTKAIVLGKTALRECPRCEGIWADTAALQHIVADREQQAAVLGVALPMPAPKSVPLEKIRYLPCPVCRKLMHRVNFAKCSNVIVDVCKAHGTWFDKDEMRRIIEFIRAGGFEQARANEMAELERQRREVEAARNAAAHERASLYGSSPCESRENALSLAAAAVLSSFFD
jgi:Zn-finger nucleic acid-binding protein